MDSEFQIIVIPLVRRFVPIHEAYPTSGRTLQQPGKPRNTNNRYTVGWG